MFCNHNYIIVLWEKRKTVLIQIIIFRYYSHICTMAIVLMAFVLCPLMLDIDVPHLNCSEAIALVFCNHLNINKEGSFHLNSSILSGTSLALTHYTCNNSRDNRCAMGPLIYPKTYRCKQFTQGIKNV